VRPRTCPGCGARLHPFGDRCEACGRRIVEHVPLWGYALAAIVIVSLIVALVDFELLAQLVLAIPRALLQSVGGET
jgi:predicted amidophosphoribosyltransferase